MVTARQQGKKQKENRKKTEKEKRKEKKGAACLISKLRRHVCSYVFAKAEVAGRMLRIIRDPGTKNALCLILVPFGSNCEVRAVTSYDGGRCIGEPVAADGSPTAGRAAVASACGSRLARSGAGDSAVAVATVAGICEGVVDIACSVDRAAVVLVGAFVPL